MTNNDGLKRGLRAGFRHLVWLRIIRRIAPGTVGSLAAILIAWPLSRIGFGRLHFLILALRAPLPGDPGRRASWRRNRAEKTRKSW